MKKIVLLIYCSCVLLLQGKAQQQYQPIFGEHTTEWLIPREFITLESGAFREMHTVSVVGEEGGYKVLSSGGKIRANETNSKLYYIEPYFSTTEILIMDLDLEVGDSFDAIYRLFNGDIKTKIFVDSVYVEDGKKHIQFDDEIGNTFSGKTKRMFIEGVGPNWGFNALEDLVACKYTDSILTYTLENEHLKDCDFRDTHIDNLIKEKDIKIHPNPASESVTIHVPAIASLSIYNALGTKVLDKKLFDLETVLDISHFPSNIYYFEFQMIDKTITKKIVKH